MSTSSARAFIEFLKRGDPSAFRHLKASDWPEILAEVGDGPLSADLFAGINATSELENAEYLLQPFIENLRDPGATQEIVALICGGIGIPDGLRKPMFDGLRKLAFEKQKHYGVRASALKGALYLGQGHAASLYRLQGDLLELAASDEPLFLRHAAAVVGVVASHRPDPPFVALLQSLSTVDEASDEAAFALGLIHLAQALGTRERSEALSLFEDSRSWFGKASSHSEDRSDAALFGAAISILLDFYNGVATAEIQGTFKVVEQRLFDQLSVHLNADARPPDQSWIGLKTTEAAHWAGLSLKLVELSGSLARDVWLDGMRVIEEQLFHVLTASRTLFNRTSSGGIEAVTGPRIESSFLKQKSHLAMLDEWLIAKRQSPWHGQAEAFRAEIQKQLENAISRQSFDAASAASTLAAVATSGGLSDTDSAELTNLIAGVEREFSLQATDPIANEMLRSMIKELQKNQDFCNHPAAGRLFIKILYVTIKFVINCDNAQSSPTTAYLFTKPDDKPLEDTIQMDYMNAIRISDLSRLCTLEPQGVGTGRADVHFAYSGHTLVTECKRSFDNLTNKEALQAFGAQLAAYQVSSVTFSALLILDLYNRAGSAQNIRDRISVETVAPNAGRSHSFAVFRVQGHRKTPSDLKLKAIAATN